MLRAAVTEFEPSATLFTTPARAFWPIATALVAVACAPSPIAVERSPCARAFAPVAVAPIAKACAEEPVAVEKTPCASAFAPVAGFGVTLANMFKPTLTEQYPFEKTPTKPRYHGRHQLNRWADGLEKCVGCELCAWACPADAILVEGADACRRERTPARGLDRAPQ